MLLNELLTDLKALDEDVCTFITPIFAAFSRYQSEFIAEVNKLFASLLPQVIIYYLLFLLITNCHYLSLFVIAYYIELVLGCEH